MADISPIGAFGLFGNFLASQVGQMHTERNMQTQHLLNKDIMNMQHSQNVQNMLMSGQFERRSRENAGLNVNNGQPFSPVPTSAVGSSAPSGSQMQPVDFAQFASLLQNKPLVEAQARLLNVEAGLKERDLKNLNEADNVYRTLSSEIEVEVEKEDGQTVKHYINIASPQAMQAYRDVKKLKSDLASYNADEALAILHKKIAEGQYKDNNVISAFVKRPVYEQKELLSRVAKAMSEVGLNAQKVLESQENIRLMLTQEQLNKMEAKIKAHENTYLLLENVFGEGHEGILSAVTLTLGLLKDVASLGSAGAKVASVMAK